MWLLNDVKTFSDAEKLHFIENVWTPRNDLLFEFPSTVESGKKRKFQRSWFQQYSWLAYSKYLDGAFCLPCVLFGRGATVDKLMKSPITCWTSATSRFKKHSSGKCDTHNTAVLAQDNFVRVMRCEAVPVNEQLDTLLRQQIATNRNIYRPFSKLLFFVVETTLLFEVTEMMVLQPQTPKEISRVYCISELTAVMKLCNNIFLMLPEMQRIRLKQSKMR